MYSKIVNPKTGRRVSIKSRLGKKILRNYIQSLLYMSGGNPPVMPLPPPNLKFFYPTPPYLAVGEPNPGAETKYALDFLHEDGVYEARRRVNNLENSPFSYDPVVLADLKFVAETLESKS